MTTNASLMSLRSVSKAAINLGRVVLTITLLAALVYLVSWAELLSAISATRWSWLLIMYCATLIGVIASACLLAILMRVSDLIVPVRRVVLATSLSVFYAMILPSDVLGGVAKWADLSAATGKKAKVLSCVVFAKAISMLPPLIIGSIALALHNPFSDLLFPGLGFGLALFIIIAFAGVLHPASGALFDRIGFAMAANLPDAFASRFQSLLAAIADFRGISAPTLLAALLLTTMEFTLGVCAYACAIWAVGEAVPLGTLIWINMALFLASLLPITVSNLGIREGFLVLVLGFYGIDPATSVAVGLLVFTNVVLVAIFGAAYKVALLGGWVAWRNEEVR